MKGTAKLLLLSSLVVLYFGLGVVGPWYADVPFQGSIAALCVLLRLQTSGWRGLRTDLAFLLPFLCTLVAMGALLDAFAMANRTDWTEDALCKALVFPNSFWSIQLAVGALRLTDLVALPRGVRRFFILTHALVSKSRPLIERLWWLVCHDPSLQTGPWIIRSGRRLTVLLAAALIAVYHETEATVRVYDARMALLEENPS